MKEFFGIGGYTRPVEGYMSWQHLLFVSSLMIVMITLAITLGLTYKNRKESSKNKVLIVAAILIDSLELFKIILCCVRAEDPTLWRYDLPLFLCSIQLITIPLAAFSKNRIKEAALDFVLIFGILGAIFGTYFAGQNYGANKRDRIWKVLIYSTIQVTVVGILIAQLELLFAHPLASLFIEDGVAAKEIIIEQAIIVMKTVLTFYFICGIYGVLAGFIRGLGNSTGPMITAVSTVLAVRSIWIYVFFPMHADRIDWLMLCYPITWIITILMNCVILVYTARKLKSDVSQEEAPMKAVS